MTIFNTLTVTKSSAAESSILMTELEIWDEIVHDLQGTCKSLFESLCAHGHESLEEKLDFLQYLDSQIFLCTTCGWWYEISEEASEDADLEEQTCRECVEEIQE